MRDRDTIQKLATGIEGFDLSVTGILSGNFSHLGPAEIERVSSLFENEGHRRPGK